MNWSFQATWHCEEQFFQHCLRHLPMPSRRRKSWPKSRNVKFCQTKLACGTAWKKCHLVRSKIFHQLPNCQRSFHWMLLSKNLVTSSIKMNFTSNCSFGLKLRNVWTLKIKCFSNCLWMKIPIWGGNIQLHPHGFVTFYFTVNFYRWGVRFTKLFKSNS